MGWRGTLNPKAAKHWGSLDLGLVLHWSAWLQWQLTFTCRPFSAYSWSRHLFSTLKDTPTAFLILAALHWWEAPIVPLTLRDVPFADFSWTHFGLQHATESRTFKDKRVTIKWGTHEKETPGICRNELQYWLLLVWNTTPRTHDTSIWGLFMVKKDNKHWLEIIVKFASK